MEKIIQERKRSPEVPKGKLTASVLITSLLLNACNPFLKQKKVDIPQTHFTVTLEENPFVCEAEGVSSVEGENPGFTPQYFEIGDFFEAKNPHIKDTVSYEFVKGLVIEQRQAMIDYLKSSTYLERLKREMAILNILNFKEKIEKVCAKDTTRAKLSEVLGEVNTSTLTDDQLAVVDSVWRARIAMVENGSWVVIDDKKLFSGLKENTLGFYTPNDRRYFYLYYILTGHAVIKSPLPPDATTTPFHEQAHQSLDGANLMFLDIENLFSARSITSDLYLSQATEIHARLNVFRYELKKLGICDPFTEDVSMEHILKYQEIIKDGKNVEQFNIPQLFRSLEIEDILWFLNNTAGIEILEIPKLDDRYKGLMREGFDDRYA